VKIATFAKPETVTTNFKDMKANYDIEANKLSKAIDIAIDAYSKFPPKDFTQANIDHVVNLHHEWKDSVLNPEPQFRKIASLKYQIENVFTFFQEATGEAVEYFWRQLSNENLGYVRVDRLRKIIDRGKIKRRIEYEFVTDQIVVAEQCGRITREESNKLSNMLGEYERSNKK
jgi:hypothetical protein